MCTYDKLKSLKVDKKNKNVVETLFAITQSTSNRSTGLKEHFDNIHIPIKAKFELRNVEQRPVPIADTDRKIHIKAEKVTNAGTKNISNMFGKGGAPSVSKEVKKEVIVAKKSPLKTETVKKESPPNKKESPKKGSKAAVASSSKGNIASFFSKAQAKPAPVKTTKEIKQEPEKNNEEKSDSKKISSIIDSDDDDEVVAGTPQEKRGVRKVPVKAQSRTKTKKATSKITQSKQHSRIAVMEDSSESEEEEERDMKRKEQKIELQISDTEDVDTERSPEKKKNVETKPTATASKRRTGVRQVIRKYQDENGFMGK